MRFDIQITSDIAACRALRLAVFVDEQGVPLDEEIDDMDNISTHLLATDENGNAVGTARLYEVGNIGKIGRVCVLKQARGTGLGAALIEESLTELRKRSDLRQAKLGAQMHAIPFYQKFGFEIVGEQYLDGGIPHFDMVLPLR